MANVEANKAYSENLADLDQVARAMKIMADDIRFRIRAGADMSRSLEVFRDLSTEFQDLADRLSSGIQAAKAMAQVTGSRGAVHVDDRNGDTVTAVWGQV